MTKAPKFAVARKRGIVTLTETILTVAVGLGLFLGGLQVFKSAQAGAELTEKSRVAVGVATEIRSQARLMASFDDLVGDSGASEAGAGTAGVKTIGVLSASALPAPMFNNLEVISADQTFDLEFSNLNEKVCNRMLLADLGPNSSQVEGKTSTAAGSCATGDLTVTYTR